MNRPSKRAVAVGIALVLAVTAVVAVSPVVNELTADCPPVLTFHETMTAPEGNGRVVDYEDLPEDRQTEFRRALDGGDVELNATNRMWETVSGVRYDGTNNSIGWIVC